MKRSDFKLVKCRGCKKPFQARIQCKPKDRPAECYYCKDCLTFRKASIIQLDNIYKRLANMEKDIDRLRDLHEKRMKELFNNGHDQL